MQHRIGFLLVSICLLGITSFPVAQTAVKPTLSNIKKDQKINGFRADAVYLNDAGNPMGGRFIHDKTGFTLDLLQIESVPQTYIWVNSLPLSNKGEPHTQEHLLITKGNKGHDLNTRESMSLAFSNAFTMQTYTAYHFNTAAGADVFYQLFEGYLDALLHPDYTDEEVHREVCNWGVAEDAATKLLRIEEKGSVYNEMKTSMNNPYAQAYNSIGKLIYGNAHPMSYNAGGNPDDIRVLDAAAIKQFHDLNYHLGNMGAITALPRTMTLDAVLNQTDKLLNKLQPTVEKHTFKNELPVPKPAPFGSIALAEYPSTNAKDPGLMLLAYPAALSLSSTDKLLLNNFLAVFAGDPSTNLYKKFIDGQTREINLGAQGLYAYADNGQGQPIFIGITDMDAENLTNENANIVRQKIREELKRIASFKDGSPELKAFNERFANNLVDFQRGLAKFTNTPPKFGYRDTYESWYQQVMEMTRITEFKKSIILKPQFEEVNAMLATGKNFWGEYFDKWKIIDNIPFVVMAKANTHLLAQQDSGAKARAATELAALKSKYKVTDDQEAIRRYKAEYDANSDRLEKLAQSIKIKFIDNPPLTLDDQLDFKTTLLPNNIPLVASTFNNMTSASTGISLRLDHLSSDQLVYLAMLPELLTQTGILKDGKAISYEDMVQQQRQQILSLNCYYSTNFRNGRAELVVKGAGNNAMEAQRSVQWMNDVLQGPNWTMENISRIRDLVNQQLNSKRKMMQNGEEAWVNDPAAAYRVQDKPLLLATSSFLTAAHNIHRLRWMLMDAGDANERNAVAAYLDILGNVKAGKDDLKELLKDLQTTDSSVMFLPESIKLAVNTFESLTPKVKKTIIEAAKDLEQVMNDIPDASLTADWQYLCRQMKKDLLQTPEKTLIALNDTRKALLHTGNARMFVIGSGATQQALQKNINDLLAGLSTSSISKVNYSNTRLIDERLKKRLGTHENPVYVGLINPNSATGVFINSVPLISYKDTSREKLLQFLAALLFAGSGKNSVYTKTTGAGLSYSTGVGTSPGRELFNYYAERTPLLPQTLSFVIDEIKRTPNDPAMSEYIISLAVSASRSSSEYETRGEAMAAELADGLSPELVKNFRQAVLRLRKMPGLMDEVYKRKDAVYEKILPGYGIKMKDVPGGVYYVIGAEKQMVAYESYLQSKDGANTKLYRIYPRDYWMPAE
jgi:Zn-dependent M16 (insulinase) family peptidase